MSEQTLVYLRVHSNFDHLAVQVTWKVLVTTISLRMPMVYNIAQKDKHKTLFGFVFLVQEISR